jgi:hypothetical protein
MSKWDWTCPRHLAACGNDETTHTPQLCNCRCSQNPGQRTSNFKNITFSNSYHDDRLPCEGRVAYGPGGDKHRKPKESREVQVLLEVNKDLQPRIYTAKMGIYPINNDQGTVYQVGMVCQWRHLLHGW